MARRKTPPSPRSTKRRARTSHHEHETPPQQATPRRFLNRGVRVEISEASHRQASDGVALTLDGVPIEVSREGGEYFSHLAHMFTGFGSMDALVDHLLTNEGRLWTLHGHVCDDGCRGGHRHNDGRGHGHDHSHQDHAHQPAARRARKAPRRGGVR